MISHAARRRLAFGAAAAMAATAVAAWAISEVSRDEPQRFEDIQQHFKYGSIGSEPGGSLLQPIGGVLPPYWVFRSLPSICPEKLSGGYASFGFIVEPGHDLPIGISRRRRLGVDQVGLNCAVCHTSTYRDAPDAPAHIMPGMPAQQLDLQRFVKFVLDCTLDDRVTAAAIRERLPSTGGPTLFERGLLRVGLVSRLKDETRELRTRIAPLLEPEVPLWGRGRVDTFNPYKAIQFNWNVAQLPLSERIGASDFPSLWNQAPREGMHLHWDGDNDSVDERNLSASLGAGVTPVTVDHDSLKRVRDWIWTLKPYTYPYPVNAELAARGETVYRQQCQACHADHRFRDGVTTGDRVGMVEDIDRLHTDRHRLDSYTSEFAANQYGLYPDSQYRFKHFSKTRGYANQPLDGVWLRAPYLHNGSVPTLRDLLEPPDKRPAVFYRGNDVFDRVKVGFVSDVPRANGQDFFRYDTATPGNGNTGHEYGTSLPEVDKLSIVEYLKRF
jgi:hypothetical protein